MSGCIVCGVDDTPGALAAAKVAAELAERLGAELVVAHVASLLVIPGASAVPNARRELRELEREEAARLVARIVDEAGCGDVEERVELGDPAERLVELADEYRATMLVVGSGGRGPLKEMILGSVSHRLCREAHSPVLVVPPAAAVSVIEPEAFAGARESRRAPARDGVTHPAQMVRGPDRRAGPGDAGWRSRWGSLVASGTENGRRAPTALPSEGGGT